MPGGLHAPLSVLAEWAKIANPSNPQERRGWGLVILNIVLSSATIAVVAARLWARLVVRYSAGIDDVLIAFALLPTLGLAVSTALGSRIYGFDRHTWDLTPALAIKSRKITMTGEGCYMLSTGLTKISILLFYRRMGAGTITHVYRWLVFGSIAFVGAYMVIFLTILFLTCRPLHAFWDKASVVYRFTHTQGVDYQCIDEPKNLMAAAAISIAQDFLACGLPALLFWNLQLPQRQKLALGAIFGIGFFLCITGILRIYYIHHIFYETYDVSWAAWEVWAWTSVEAHMAIICASAPALKVFLSQYFKLRSFTESFTKSLKTQTPYNNQFTLTRNDDSAYGTTSTVSPYNKHIKDVEMGGINVTREVDVDSHSMRADAFEENDVKRSFSSDEMPIHISTPVPSRGQSRRTSWIFKEPSIPNSRPQRNEHR